MAVSLQYTIYLSSIYDTWRYPIGYTDRGGYPTDRAPVGWEHRSGRRYPIRVYHNPYLSYLTYHIIVPTGKGSIIILPILSIVFHHQPTGGESYGLDNRPAA